MAGLKDMFLTALFKSLRRIGQFEFPWLLWRLFPRFVRLACYRKLQSHNGSTYIERWICKLPCGWILKHVNRSPLPEVDNTRFVEANTSIPVPRILDAVEYTDGPHVRGLIVMTYIEGEALNDWIAARVRRTPAGDARLAELDAALDAGDTQALERIMVEMHRTLPPPVLGITGNEDLLQDLRSMVGELRSISPPSNAVGGLNGRPLEIIRAGDHLSNFGPFESSQAFKAAMIERVNPTLFADRMPTLRRLADPVLARAHRVCFTHADLHGGNILVKDGRLAGVLDWECAGWLPEYWERTSLEGHVILEPLMHQFWDAVHPFGPRDAYDGELALEYALWMCTGDTAIVGPDVNLVCPRVQRSPMETR